jgi:putative transposase
MSAAAATIGHQTDLALRNITADWGRAANNWKSAMNQFAILYEERFTQEA